MRPERESIPPGDASWPSRMLSRLKAVLLGVPLRMKILGLALGLILLFGAVITYMAQIALRENIDSFLQQESRFVAQELSHQVRDSLLINDLYGLTLMLHHTVQNRPDLRYAVVINPQRHVVAHTFGNGFPVDLLVDIERTPPSPDRPRRLHTSEGPLWEGQARISEGTEGFVRVGVKGDSLHQQVSRLTRTMVQVTLLIALGTVGLSLLLTWLITRPVSRLLQATKAVQRGDYSLRLPCESNDELGRLTEAFNAMMASLGKAEQTRQEKEMLQRDFLHRVMAGQEGERKRIARELHDQTGQALAAFMVDLKVLETTTTQAPLREGIQRLKNAVMREMGALHDLAVELRPSVLDDLGLIPAMEMLVRNFKNRHGLHAELTTVGFGDHRAEPCTETCVYRIVQESLTNIAKHAGAAATVTVLLEWRGDKIRGVIEDDGVGFEASQLEGTGKLGIFGMRERVQLLQGSFRIESSPGQGTMVAFDIPATVEVCHERS